MTTTTTTGTTPGDAAGRPGPQPMIQGRRRVVAQVGVYVFVLLPMVALVAAVPLAWEWGLLNWVDVVLAVVFFYFSGLGVTIGYHRYLTHSAFKAKRWLRILLSIAGSCAVQGPPTVWVADHRRHHAYSDREGDPVRHEAPCFRARVRDPCRCVVTAA